MDPQSDLVRKLQEGFAKLPKPVRDAITSADVQAQMRKLADASKLHVDQYQLLQNEVMLTLLGFQEPDKLAENLKSDLEIPLELAQSLAADVSRIVFEPIRQRLERELQNPDAKPAEISGVEAAGQAAIAQEKAQAVQPATPPNGTPAQKAERAPISEAYRAGEPSSLRRNVADDPYREPPV